MREAGLEVSCDPAGNLYGRAAGGDPSLAEVWSGSHLDTPFDGGRFDGALGVLAALDVAEAIAASGGAPEPWPSSRSGSRRARASAAASSAVARSAGRSSPTRPPCATATG